MTETCVMKIHDWPAAERPREKLMRLGAAALSEAELIAIWLRAGRPGQNAVELARALLAKFGSLRGLFAADAARLGSCPGVGPARYAELQAVLELARRHHLEALYAGPPLTSPRLAADYLLAQLRDRDHEVFCCLYLDNRHRLIGFEELFKGTIDGASVHPREVVKQALARRAAAVILAHYVAGHKMRVMCPESFCARFPKKFGRRRIFFDSRHITAGLSGCLAGSRKSVGWLLGHDGRPRPLGCDRGRRLGSEARQPVEQRRIVVPGRGFA